MAAPHAKLDAPPTPRGRARPVAWHRLLRVVGFVGLGMLAGVAFVAVRRIGPLATGCAIGATISLGIIGVDLLVERSRPGAWLRRLPLVAVMAAIALAYLAVILPTLAVANRIESGVFALESIAVLYSFAVSLAFSAANRIGRLIGWRILGNVLIGRYYRPVGEQRIFLFLDLADSTSLAERLGELRVQALIAAFYFDIARPIAEHRGEVYQYRGDEISVTWPLAAGLRDAACIACARAIRAHIAARAAWYRSRFDTVPAFRIGIHGGSVVAGEVGDDRREIMYFGDTINTAARIQALCKTEGRDTCVSGSLLAQLRLPDGVTASPLGHFRLRGKQQEVEVFSLAGA